MTIDWAKVAAQEYALPEGLKVETVLAELLDMLGHANPVIRDEQAYGTLASWVGAGYFDEVLKELGDTCAHDLSSENVLLRSFSALILGECVRRQASTKLLDVHIPAIWYACWERWYAHEPDVRSFEDGVGWIHTVAHGADFAFEWALYANDHETLRHLCEALHQRIASIPISLQQGEDDRLALAFLAIFSATEFEASDLQEWSSSYRTLWADLPPGPLPPHAHLAVKTLQSLHTLLHLGAQLGETVLRPAYPEAALDAVQDALRGVNGYYGTRT